MIRRYGHYILETGKKSTSGRCLKCDQAFGPVYGRASTSWIFDGPCKGNWSKAFDRWVPPWKTRKGGVG